MSIYAHAAYAVLLIISVLQVVRVCVGAGVFLLLCRRLHRGTRRSFPSIVVVPDAGIGRPTFYGSVLWRTGGLDEVAFQSAT